MDQKRLQQKHDKLEAENLSLKQPMAALQSGMPTGGQPFAMQQPIPEGAAGLQQQLHETADALDKLLKEKLSLQVECTQRELQITELSEALEKNIQIHMQQTDELCAIRGAARRRRRHTEELRDEINRQHVRMCKLEQEAMLTAANNLNATIP